MLTLTWRSVDRQLMGTSKLPTMSHDRVEKIEPEPRLAKQFLAKQFLVYEDNTNRPWFHKILLAPRTIRAKAQVAIILISVE